MEGGREAEGGGGGKRRGDTVYTTCTILPQARNL